MTDHNTKDVLEIPDFLRRAKASGPATKTRAPRRKAIKVPELKLAPAPASWADATTVQLEPGHDWLVGKTEFKGAAFARPFLVKHTPRSRKYVWVRDAKHAFGYRTKAWVKDEVTKQPTLQKVVKGIQPVVKLTKAQFERALIKGETE